MKHCQQSAFDRVYQGVLNAVPALKAIDKAKKSKCWEVEESTALLLINKGFPCDLVKAALKTA